LRQSPRPPLEKGRGNASKEGVRQRKRGGKVIKNSPLFEKEGLGEIFKNNKNLRKSF
jgi:hypothetical protein